MVKECERNSIGKEFFCSIYLLSMESESTKEMATSLRSIYFVLGRLRVCREQKGRGRKNTEGSGCMRVEVYLSSKQRGKQDKARKRKARQVKQWTRDTGNRTAPVNNAESGKGDDGCGGTDGIGLITVGCCGWRRDRSGCQPWQHVPFGCLIC